MKCTELLKVYEISETFMGEVGIERKPKLLFVNKGNHPEYKVNEFYERSNTIYFNADFFRDQTLPYVLLIVLHEIYHFSKQHITDIHDVTFIRDNKQWSFMQICDVEADIHVAVFMKKAGFIETFADYLTILYQGTGVFKDSNMRMPKLERFIGSLSSIRNAFDTDHKTLWLPQISYPSVFIMGVDFYQTSLQYHNVPLDKLNVARWSDVFQNASSLGADLYISTLNTLTGNFIANIKTGGHYEA